MTLRERFNLPVAIDDSLAYSTPHVTADGTTVITVAKPAKLLRRGGRPLGMFVVRGEEAKFVPVTDATRIALMGELIGLAAAAFATFALVRRPPWPDMKININKDDRDQ